MYFILCVPILYIGIAWYLQFQKEKFASSVINALKQDQACEKLAQWTDEQEFVRVAVSGLSEVDRHDAFNFGRSVHDKFDWAMIGYGQPGEITVVYDYKSKLVSEVRFCQGWRFYVSVRMSSNGDSGDENKYQIFHNGRVKVIDYTE
jgi:hypothetical protein